MIPSVFLAVPLALGAADTLQYAAKFVCGPATRPAVARGTYYTAINVHYPGADSIFRRRPGSRAS